MNAQGVVSIRFEPEQARELSVRAAERGLTVSAYLRHIITRETLLARPGARRWTADNGADIAIWTNVGSCT